MKPKQKKSTNSNSLGFTLIELLVVISVIGLLSSIIFSSLQSAREKARIAIAAQDVRILERAVNLYYADTGRMPQTCDSSCTVFTDPFMLSLGVAGWKGPYTTLWSKAHPWKGHLSIITDTDLDGDGIFDCAIQLDDDRPTMGGSDNGGLIPVSSLTGVDKIIDDGDLSTGAARGNGLGNNSVLGELVLRCLSI